MHLAVLVMELCGIASTLAAMFRRHPESLIEMMMDLFFLVFPLSLFLNFAILLNN